MHGICTEAARMVWRRTNCAGGASLPIRRLVNLSAALSLAFAVAVLCAQKPPSAKKPGTTGPQQPGSGAQVHAGTASGLDTDTRLMNMLADHQFIRLEGELDALPPWQAQYYRGILANRNNDTKKSIELLEPLVDSISATGNVL